MLINFAKLNSTYEGTCSISNENGFHRQMIGCLIPISGRPWSCALLEEMYFLLIDHACCHATCHDAHGL